MDNPTFANGYALVIAVNENQIPGYALPTVAKDATAVRDVLIHPQRCAYAAENVRLLLGRDATREGIRGGLAWLKERIAADSSGDATAVFFYSGHGAYNPDDNSYYLLPYDLRSPLADSLLRAEDVAAEIEAVQPRRLLVVLDCCHAGGMGIKGEDLMIEGGLRKSAAPAEARPVVALARGQGRAALSSSSAAESSYVRSDRAMSIFTYHFVEALTGHAQGEGATEVLVSDIMGHVSRAVPASARAEYDAAQTPVYQTSGENFPVALLLGGKGISKGAPLPSPTAPLPPVAGPTINTGGGATFGGPVTAAGDIQAGRKTVGGDEIRGSKYVMSGDFRGAVLNIESQLSNVTQSIMAAAISGPAKGDLNSLVAALEAELGRVPAERAKEAEAVAGRLAKLTAAAAEGDGEMADINGRALERAADALGDIRAALPATARQLTAAVRRVLGI
ncbi:MAG: caspase family protein [Candidatus Promineofilum sp.]|nr:caspase family protein [Promineifilum sp.]